MDAAAQRVGTTAVAPQGSLVAGLSQWLAVSVVSKHDEVHGASVIVSGLEAPDSSASESGTVPLRLQLQQDSFITKLDSTPGAKLASEDSNIYLIHVLLRPFGLGFGWRMAGYNQWMPQYRA